MLSVMDEIAGETGATLAQIALAWLKSQPAIAAPLASATTTEQLDQLVKAVTMALSPDQISRLNRGGRS